MKQTAKADMSGKPVGGAIIELAEVNYGLQVGGSELHILKDVSLSVREGETVAIVGPSGSGKTSLLMLIAGLERATSGEVLVGGRDLSRLNEDQLSDFRRDTLGIVFQSFHLIPSLTALDNVALALQIASPGLGVAELRNVSTSALKAVGLADRLDHRPAALSGGEQQRVGLARAMVANPRLLLADEPTGSLDQQTGEAVADLMFEMARQRGATVLLITHDPDLADRADRVLTMSQGHLTETGRVTRR